MLGAAVPKPDGWTVGIEHPWRTDALGAALRFGSPAAVCTSSVRRNRWQHEGRWVHHLIDPVTHEPGGSGLISVTVAHRVPTWAEVWNKVLMLRGADQLERLATALRLNVWWFRDDGSWGATPAAREHIAWIHPELSVR